MAGGEFPASWSSKRRAAIFGLLFLFVRHRISFASPENHVNQHQQRHHRSYGSLGLHPSPHYEGPLAPGLQVSGGSRLKKAARKVRARAFRRVNLTPPPKLESTDSCSASTTSTEEECSTVVNSQVYYETADIDTNIQENTNPDLNSDTRPATFITNHPPTVAFVPSQQQRQRQQQLAIHDTAIPRKAILYMSLLAVQFGIQPLLVRRFVGSNSGICKSSVVLVQELVKGVIAGVAYMGTTNPEHRKKELGDLSVTTWLTMAGIPAAIYTVQNLASLLAYQNLEALTFNVLNQTKILSAALCCYLVMGKRQTKVQSFSLVLLLVSALVIEKVLSFKSILAVLGGGSSLLGFSQSMQFGRRFTHGVVPVLFASFLSGLAGALTQKNLQGVSKTESSSMNVTPRKPKNAYLFSMELTAASVIVLLMSLLISADGKSISENGFFHRWELQTMIPIITNSFGGILVGLVTKHAGSVRKGFALIFGILLSGLLQAGSAGISPAQIVGGILAATSLWLHTTSGV